MSIILINFITHIVPGPVVSFLFFGGLMVFQCLGDYALYDFGKE